jgi:hypothetical protein
MKGKKLADLQTAELKKILLDLEQRRDTIYDEIAFKRGQQAALEELIQTLYERILGINKEVQTKQVVELSKAAKKKGT